jgi:hypothetical protein
MADDTTVDSLETSRHISRWIAAPASAVYAVASDPARLAQWAAGLADPALGDAEVEFAVGNGFGVLDHVVRMPSGQTFYNPMRVIPEEPGSSRSEVIFTLRRRAGVSDEEFEADAAAVAADLATLRSLVEG